MRAVVKLWAITQSIFDGNNFSILNEKKNSEFSILLENTLRRLINPE